jgi:MinD superfamily P-loop ATPase
MVDRVLAEVRRALRTAQELKSTVVVNLSLTLAAMGFRVGALDRDLNGPDIPHLLGVHPVASRNALPAHQRPAEFVASDRRAAGDRRRVARSGQNVSGFWSMS